MKILIAVFGYSFLINSNYLLQIKITQRWCSWVSRSMFQLLLFIKTGDGYELSKLR